MQSKDWFNDILLAFLAILPVVNPFSKPPIFLSITEGWTNEERRNEAFKASLYAFIILLVSLLAGTFVLAFFSHFPARAADRGRPADRAHRVSDAQPAEGASSDGAEEHDAKQREDVSFVPLAMPLLSGPGSMAVMINLATEVKFWAEWLIYIAAAGAVCVISFFVLAESVWVARFLGVNGMNALSKLMGFLLLALAIQFMIAGVDKTLHDLLMSVRKPA